METENVKTKKKLTKKQIAMIVTATLLAVIILALAIGLPVVYNTGNLATMHPLKKAEEGQIKVACVGDSITYGAGVKGWPENSYPNVLNGLLGDGYCVNNYGFSARTAMYDGDYPYADEKLYQQSMNFAPDVVVIMFGSNDSKPKNWKNATAFSRDLSKLIDSFMILKSRPEIYVVSPPPAFGVNGKPVAYDIREEVIRDEIRPAVAALAIEKGLHYIDMYEVFTGRPELYSDGVHPTAEGAKLFAQTVYAAIKG